MLGVLKRLCLPPYREIRPGKLRRVLGAIFQELSRQDLVAVVPLRPVVADQEVCSQLRGIEMSHDRCNGRVDDGRLLDEGMVPEGHDIAVEPAKWLS